MCLRSRSGCLQGLIRIKEEQRKRDARDRQDSLFVLRLEYIGDERLFVGNISWSQPPLVSNGASRDDALFQRTWIGPDRLCRHTPQ